MLACLEENELIFQGSDAPTWAVTSPQFAALYANGCHAHEDPAIFEGCRLTLLGQTISNLQVYINKVSHQREVVCRP
jgi:hypothetical protein